jgi:putative endonuclease
LTRPSSRRHFSDAARFLLHHGEQARNGTLYLGVTSNLAERVAQHKEGHGSEFVKRYNVTMLVWYEEWALITDAIQRETSLKRWPRKWKLELIERSNPDWRDLAEGLV